MNRVLIYHPQVEYGNVLKEYLKSTCGVSSVFFNDFNELKASLDIAAFSLVISFDTFVDSEDRKIDAAKILLNTISDSHLNLPLFVLGDIDVSFGNIKKFKKEIEVDAITKEVIKALGISKEELEYIKMPDYIPISIQNFYQLNHPCCDIYIRIKKQDGDQFIKRINADEEMDKEVVKKYESMNLSELFVKKESYAAIMNQILTQSISRIVEAHKSGTNINEVSADAFEISQNLIDQLGITVQTVKMAKVSIKSMMKTISSNQKLSSLLKDILQNEASYSYKRSYLISLFSFQIMPELGWGRGEQLMQNLEKMTFVSFFHDCYLRDEKLLRINSNAALEASELTGAEKTLVLEHANRASTLVQGIPQCPTGIDVIIRQHHGAANGVGFPEQLSSSISPMAVVFVVIEDLASQILEFLYTKNKLSLDDILKNLEERYTLPSFRKVVEILRQLLRK